MLEEFITLDGLMKGERRSLESQARMLACGGGSLFTVPLCFQMCLQNMVQLTVDRDRNRKRYKLEELLELQNKLMLMSTKGEHGIEQVRRFTEVSDIY